MSPLSTASLPPSYAGALVMPDLVCLSDTEEERGSLRFVLLFYLILNVSVHFEDFDFFFFHAQLQIVQKITTYTI